MKCFRIILRGLVLCLSFHGKEICEKVSFDVLHGSDDESSVLLRNLRCSAKHRDFDTEISRAIIFFGNLYEVFSSQVKYLTTNPIYG